MRVLLLHGYSARNIGDGLLVQESVQLIRDAFPSTKIEFTACVFDPKTFNVPEVRFLRSKPGRLGYDLKYLTALNHLDDFDLIVGVGGGYFRGRNFMEIAKMTLTHGIQLYAASRMGSRVVYLPQSIGPFTWGSGPWVKRRLAKLKVVWVRDDRSLAELGSIATRIPDLAVLMVPFRELRPVDSVPILSVRGFRGRNVPKPVRELSLHLNTFDGYVQSFTGSNDDLLPMQSLNPHRILSKDELMSDQGRKRVVIAVRLHAALMALHYGHYVIHLSYQRKGFAAFEDLGLGDFVHNAFSFSPEHVHQQARDLLSDVRLRAKYDAIINDAARARHDAREQLTQSLVRTVLEAHE